MKLIIFRWWPTQWGNISRPWGLPQSQSSHFGEGKPQGHFDEWHSIITFTQRKETHKIYYVQIPEQGSNELEEGQSSIPGQKWAGNREEGSKHLAQWSLIFSGLNSKLLLLKVSWGKQSGNCRGDPKLRSLLNGQTLGASGVVILQNSWAPTQNGCFLIITLLARLELTWHLEPNFSFKK